VGREAAFAQFGRYGGDTGGTFQAELREHFYDLHAWDEFWS
jgi:hypothetical protein